MNGYGRTMLQALMVVVILAIVVAGVSLLTNPTSHEEIDQRLARVEQAVRVNNCLILTHELTPEAIAACQ